MSRKLLIKPFHSIESTATASHNWRRRQVLRAGASTIALALLGPKLAYASSVLAVRVWPARDYSGVAIRSDQPLQNSQQLLQGPDRLVVDLNGLDLDQELKDLVSKITPNDPQIQSVRIGQYQPHVVRMVFDLKGSVKPQVFTLTPIGSYKYRLVFDLYPAVAPDPLMDLLAQSEHKQQAFDQTNPNPAPPPATLSGPATPPKANVPDNTDEFFQKYAQSDLPRTPSPSAPAAPVPPVASPPPGPRPACRAVPEAPAYGQVGAAYGAGAAAGRHVRQRHQRRLRLFQSEEAQVRDDAPAHRRDRPGPWRRRSGRDRQRRDVRETHCPRCREEAARQDRCPAEHARDDDARRRLLRAAQRARTEGASSRCGPVRFHS